MLLCGLLGVNSVKTVNKGFKHSKTEATMSKNQKSPKNLEDITRDAQISSEYLARGFSEHYFGANSGANIEPIDLDSVPDDALAKFEFKSSQFIHIDDYTPRNFDNVLHIRHNDGSSSYVAIQTKIYKGLGETERLTYVVDLTAEDDLQGYGEIRFNTSGEANYFRCKPSVGHTRTEETHRRKGLGARRLYIMNALALAIYSAPLNSDTLINDAAKRIWERLVSKGEAYRYMEGETSRFVFAEEMPGWHSSDI